MVAKFLKKRTRPEGSRRRGIVAIQVGVMLAVLLGAAAMTIDVGQIYAARGELQRAADAAALAGATALMTDDMMDVRNGVGSLDGVVAEAISRSNAISHLNKTLNEATHIEFGDVLSGEINLNSGTDPLDQGAAAADYNAIQVTVHRNAAGSNGQVPLFFSGVFGRFYSDSIATATAAFDDRFSGFDFDIPGGGIAPFAMSREAYEQDLNNGPDFYSYDDVADNVFNAADGTREIRIYPYPYSGSGYTEGDGNFGMLNIGSVGQGTSTETAQIEDGVTSDQIFNEIGTTDPDFENNTYEITGSPGMVSSIKSTLEPMVGQVIGFFLHDGVVLSGSNATYTISSLRFGRIMAVKLTGAPSTRGIFIQPVSYVGNGVTTSPTAPSTNGELGRIVLVR